MLLSMVDGSSWCCYKPRMCFYLSQKNLNNVLNQLDSILTVPALSTGKGVHFIWSGLENSPGSFVAQSVIGDQQLPGYWSAAMWFGPNNSSDPLSYREVPSTPVQVFEGDLYYAGSFLNFFGNFHSFWRVFPGPISKGANVEEKKGTFDSSSSDADMHLLQQLTNVVFEIELQQGASWDFGPQVWEYIHMEANTTDTTWCREPSLGVWKFKYNMTEPWATAVEDRGFSICLIERLTFESP